MYKTSDNDTEDESDSDDVGKNREGILFALLYLKNELSRQGMTETEVILDKTIECAIGECVQHGLSEEETRRITLFLKQTFQLEGKSLEHFLQLMDWFDGKD